MPVASVKFIPGVNAEVSQTLGQAQITSSNLIRFKQAGPDVVPEKLGGWTKFYGSSLGSAVRDLHAWEGINADSHLAAGCEQSLDIITDGVLADVTPRTEYTTPTPSFTTVASSNSVTVDDPSFTASIYDSIYLLTPISIGGIILQGAYQITSVIDADTYTIDAVVNAVSSEGPAGAVPQFTTTTDSPTINVELANHGYFVGQTFNIPAVTATTVGGLTLSGAYIIQTIVDVDNFTINAANSATSNDTQDMNGGDAGIIYYIGIGPSVPSSGYGAGTYGSGAYGVGVVPPSSPGSPITATNWTLDNWGEVLLACPADAPIYQFSPDLGLANATRILEAPEVNGGIFVSQPAQILVAWASSQGGVQDPLSINWSDSGDYTNWTVTSQTQAGGYRLPTGSKIVGGLAGPSFGIIWTDLEVWSMDYINPPLIFGFNSLGSNCGLLARHGAAVLNSIPYWISNNKFCLLNGENVQTIPCSVWDFIFQDLDTDHVDKIYCGTNSLFGEVTWYFPSASGGTGEVDSYVKYMPELGLWDYGRLARSAWSDQSPVGPPVGGTPGGFLFQHETSPDADGQPLLASFSTGFFQTNDGNELEFIDWMMPDFRYGYFPGVTGAVVQVTISFTDYPNGAPVKTQGPFAVTKNTTFVNPRLRARFASVTIASLDLGSFWRMGAIKFRETADGKQ